MHQTEDKCMH